MGLSERDYMRDLPGYRQIFGLGEGSAGGTPPKPPTGRPRTAYWWDEKPRRARTRPWAWFLLGVIVTLVGVGYVAEEGLPFLEDGPVVVKVPEAQRPAPPTSPATSSGRTVAIIDGVPVVGPPLRIPIAGPELLPVGTQVELSGRSPMARAGRVVAKLRWNGGDWQTVQRTPAASDGSYRVRISFDRPGRAQLRIVFEGGSFAFKWYRVG